MLFLLGNNYPPLELFGIRTIYSTWIIHGLYSARIICSVRMICLVRIIGTVGIVCLVGNNQDS